MYEFISGRIDELTPARIVVEAGGIGDFITIFLNTYSRITGKDKVHLMLHQVVKDDAHVLYGFADKQERDLFRLLISVNGVGAGTAIMMLSSLNADELSAAVASGNVDLLKSVKGIGIKTAQRIIIDLKDKLGKLPD